jgi:hypothetical protein
VKFLVYATTYQLPCSGGLQKDEVAIEVSAESQALQARLRTEKLDVSNIEAEGCRNDIGLKGKPRLSAVI